MTPTAAAPRDRLTRRRWLVAVLLAAAGVPRVRAAPALTVSAAQLQRAVAERFPLRVPVAGLLMVDFAAPALRMLAAEGRVGAEFVVRAAGPALHVPRSGRFDVDFELRYEPADRTVRAHRVRVNALRFDGLSPQGAAVLDRHAPALAAELLQDTALHRLDASALAPLDDLGLQPGPITVSEAGLSIALLPKPL